MGGAPWPCTSRTITIGSTASTIERLVAYLAASYADCTSALMRPRSLTLNRLAVAHSRTAFRSLLLPDDLPPFMAALPLRAAGSPLRAAAM